MIESFHFEPQLEPHVRQILERVSKGHPTCARRSLYLLSIIGDPSETLDNLLQPRNEFVARKCISVFREVDGVSKEARLVRE